MTDNKKIMNDEKLEQVAGGGRPNIRPRQNPFRDYGDYTTVENEKEIKAAEKFKDVILKDYIDNKNSPLYQDNRPRIDFDEGGFLIANKEK